MQTHAGEFLAPPAAGANSDAFLRGAHHACKQTERATKRLANMLQASCVAADISADMDRSEIVRRCFGPSNRSAFVRLAETTCRNSKI
jgi:hypothetical protein